jgi:hypothetical protein
MIKHSQKLVLITKLYDFDAKGVRVFVGYGGYSVTKMENITPRELFPESYNSII